MTSDAYNPWEDASIDFGSDGESGRMAVPRPA